MRKSLLFVFTVFVCTISYGAAKVTPATGGTNLLSDFAAESVSPAWTSLGAITIAEKRKNDFAAGTNATLVLNAPAGFEFNVAATPGVLFASGKDISIASAAVVNSTTLRITFTVSGTGGLDTLVIGGSQPLQVRPTRIFPLASGSIVRPSGGTGGTAVIAGIKAAGTKTGKGVVTSFGTLVEVAGVATDLGMKVQPSVNAVVGLAFGQQPVIAVLDSGGNVRKTDNGRLVTASISTGPGTLSGTLTATTVNGLATFTNLALSDVGSVTLIFSATNLTDVESAPINVVPGPPPPSVATSLSMSVQPSAANIAGVAFAQQPVVAILDQYDFPFTNENSAIITASVLSGDGTLQGTLTAQAVNGVATFTNLSHTNVTDLVLGFSSAGLNSTVSDTITINPAPASRLVFDVQPDLAGVGRLFEVQPVVITQDSFGNDSAVGLASALNVTMTLSSGSGTLTGTTVLDIGTNDGNGAVTFTDLSINAAGDKQLTASASGLSSALSDIFTVVPKTNQSITFFADIPSKTYGTAPFNLSATASSGLPVTFSIVAGPATISGSTVTITGVGTVTARASQDGNSNYLAALSIDQNFAVVRAPLVASGNNASRVYGTTNPIFAGTLVGLTNGDVITASFSSTATATSNPGTYSITPILSDPNSRLTNYAVTTNAGTLTISSVPPSISTQPQDISASVGGTATFSVGATGPLLSYQWQFEGANVNGATASSLVISPVQAGNAGMYSVIVSNGSGVVTSSNATLVIGTPPSILSQPTTVVTPAGVNFTLALTTNAGFVLAGTQPFTYQWQKTGIAIAGQTTSVLHFAAVKSTNAGNYSIVLGNAVGTVTSAPIALVVGTVLPPHIVSNLVSDSVIIGDSYTFKIVATGSALNYQWKFNNLPILGATTSSFTLASAQLTDTGDYSVIVSNIAGAVLSSNATLTVNYDPNVITNDVDSDGNIDILVQSTSTNNNYLGIWNLAGTNFFDSFLLNDGVPLTTGWKLVAQGDFNHDNQIDYVFQNGGYLNIWLMNGTNMQSSVAVNTNAFGRGWKVVAARDFNRDGNTDLVLRHDAGYTAIWLMKGTKIVRKVLLRGGLAISSAIQIVGCEDFNHDGYMDLLLQNTKTGKLTVWYMVRAVFKRSAFLAVAPSPVQAWKVAGMVDLNGAAPRDILWQHTNGTLLTWYMNGTNILGSNYLNVAVPPEWRIVGQK